jgi:hypothetical protein
MFSLSPQSFEIDAVSIPFSSIRKLRRKRDSVIVPKTQSGQKLELIFEPRQSDSRIYILKSPIL